jgi:hypothetical protein
VFPISIHRDLSLRIVYHCEYILVQIQTRYLRHDTPQVILGAPSLVKATALHLVNATTTAILQTSMNSLAIELIDAIIGHVDEKDNDEKDNISCSDLLTCSPVCRFWLPSTQRRLFHHIKLRHRAWGDSQLHGTIQRLDQILLHSPHLAS